MAIHRQLAEVNTALSHEFEIDSPYMLRLDRPTKPEIKVTSLDPPRIIELQNFNRTRRGEFPICGLLWTVDAQRTVQEVFCVVAEERNIDFMYGYEINQTIYDGLVSATARIRSTY